MHVVVQTGHAHTCDVVQIGHVLVGRLVYVYKHGLVLGDWIAHISIGADICKMSLVFRVGNLLECFLFSIDDDKTQRLQSPVTHDTKVYTYIWCSLCLLC